MDVDTIIDRSLFLPIGLLLAATMIVVALVIAFIFKLGVARPAGQGREGRRRGQGGRSRRRSPADTGNDEIGRLSRSFATMAASVQDNMRTLEHLVEERTAELQSLAYRDQLTGIANRRGFADGFDGIKAAAEPDARLALLLIDIDRFKDINDTHGHQAGDEVAAEMARRIAAVLRPDRCLRPLGRRRVHRAVLRSRQPAAARPSPMRCGAACRNPVTLQIGRDVPVTVSIGACLVEPDETLEQVADMADAALYIAKEDGRDRVSVYDPTSRRSEAGRHAALAVSR